jgi:hypothetical protein
MVNKQHGNAGSCNQYINYLEKENIGKPITTQEYFFNDKSNFIAARKAEGLIDGSPKQGIRGKDAKYFEVIMSFKAKEIKGKTNQQLKDFVKEAFPKMYAESVKGKTINPEKLIWVAKLEQQRKYKDTSPLVKNGIKQKGALKEGDQRHFHIIIARKTSDNAVSISPLTSYQKGSKGVIKSGFERNHLRQAYEMAFDKKFNYQRPLEESFKYQNTIKHGTGEEKKQMQELVPQTKQYQEPILEIGKQGYAQEEEEQRKKRRKRGLGR